MNEIKFSIIMPCYNSASHNFFIDAIESVIAQEYQNWELIAVNDGSTDKTLDILNNYAAKDERVKVFSKDNGGYSSAINTGLGYLTGDYFLMMGSDDQLFPDLLKEIVAEIGKDSPDLIAFRTIKFVDGVLKGLDNNTNFESKAFLYNAIVAEYVEKYPDHAKILLSMLSVMPVKAHASKIAHTIENAVKMIGWLTSAVLLKTIIGSRWRI